MLGKLLKYEFKSSARMLPIVYIAIAAAYLVGLLAKALDISQIKFTMSIVLVIGGIAAGIMTLVTVIVRYSKGLFGAEGYLAQTLPVSKGSLIACKVISAYIWMIISCAVAVFAFFAVFQLYDMDMFGKLFDFILGKNAVPFTIYILLTGCLQLLAFLGELYFAITLANTRPFIKSNVGFSILFYFVTNFIVGMLEMLSMFFIPLGIRMSENGFAWTTESMFHSVGMKIAMSNSQLVGDFSIGIGSGIIDVAAGLALLFVTRWLLTQKTSVK